MGIPPVISNLVDLLRAKQRVEDPVINRFQQPVPKVQRRDRYFDGFEDSRSSNRTPVLKAGPQTATNFKRTQHQDAFEAAVKKPVELASKPPPEVRAAPAWLKQNDRSMTKPDFVASFADIEGLHLDGAGIR